jgi:ABC-type amino acid transport substrate-binding protein
MEKESARYWAEVYKTKIAFPLQHTEGYVRVRLRKQKKALIPKINQGIQAIIQSGELEAILLQHGIVDALP